MTDESCACEVDGYCDRYRRRMTGHMRKICRGEVLTPETCQAYRKSWLEMAGLSPLQRAVQCPHAGDFIRTNDNKPSLRKCPNCPGETSFKVFNCLHPAREPDQVTEMDCARCMYRPRASTDAKPLILQNPLPPGDNLVMTAAVHSLHLAHPGKFLTAVATSHQAIFEHNPDVIPVERAREMDAEEVMTHYPLVDQSNNQAVHVMEGYCRFLANHLRVEVPLAVNHPLVYLSRREKSWLPQVHEKLGRKARYWVMVAGYKNDCTTKFWGARHFQEVVDRSRGRVLFVQVGAERDNHASLDGVLSLVGKTDIRQLIRLCYHAEGGIGGVTFVQHLMAALQKPYICVMGGREPVQWNSYPKQQLLHTVGILDCCRDRACWKSRVRKLDDGATADASICVQPGYGLEVLPRCMDLITPDEVLGALDKFQLTLP